MSAPGLESPIPSPSRAGDRAAWAAAALAVAVGILVGLTAGSRWGVLAGALTLAATGTAMSLRTIGIDHPTRAHGALEVVWMVVPVAFLAVLGVLVARAIA